MILKNETRRECFLSFKTDQGQLKVNKYIQMKSDLWYNV